MIGKNLQFISLIKRDGSGTIPVGTEWDETKDYPKTDDVSYLDFEDFKLNCLSMSHNTYIAHGFNSWVVKKKTPNHFAEMKAGIKKVNPLSVNGNRCIAARKSSCEATVSCECVEVAVNGLSINRRFNVVYTVLPPVLL